MMTKMQEVEANIDMMLANTRNKPRAKRECENVTNYCDRCLRGRRFSSKNSVCPDRPANGYVADSDLWSPPECYMWG